MAEVTTKEELIAFEKEDAWLHKQIEDESFQTKFKNKFVAIRDNKIVDDDEDITNLINKLRIKKLNISQIFVEFVYPKGLAVFF